MNVAATAETPSRQAGIRPASRFFVDIAVLMTCLVIAGFWPYYGRVVRGMALPAGFQHGAIHVHSTLFLGWMLLFALQAGLVWRRRTDLHRYVGPLIAGYGAFITVVGLYAAFVLPAHGVHTGRGIDSAAAVLFTTLTDVLMFGGLLAAAIVYRRRPALHRALIFLATLSLAVVGETRLVGRVLLPLVSDHLARLVVLVPVFLVMGHEWVTRRRVHPIYVAGALLLFFRFDRPRFGNSDIWLPIGRALLGPFL
jgi:hypothetical protein